VLFAHEGLPRSGKSYEAVVKHVLPAIKAGRSVVAAVDGLDAVRVAQIVGVPLDEVNARLVVLSSEQVPEFWRLVPENSLVVLDEVQNYWGGSAKLHPELVKWIAEHGHHGVDVLLLGQDMRDVHPLWRRRIQRKTLFVKLSALGAENRYTATVYESVGTDKYRQVSQEICTYDKRYFGVYKSHVASSVQTGNYKDKRASFLRNGLFRFGLPVALVVGVWSAWSVTRFFDGGFASEVDARSSKIAAGVRPGASVAPAVVAPVSQVAAALKKPAPVLDLVQEAMKAWRARLDGYMRMGERQQGVFVWYAPGGMRMQSFTFAQLEQFGYSVAVRDGIAVISGRGERWAVDAWPLDPVGKVTHDQTELIAGRRL
jgi:zona occludens toxin